MKSSGAGSRTPTSPRALRELIAAKQGKLQIAKGFNRVGLTITEIVSGTLDDPDYARRPIGTNHLEVVLLDDAAFASDDSLAGFEGTWRLSRTAGGVLYVSSIKDTPYPAELAGARTALIAKTRAGLRGSANARLEALETLAEHSFLELVPDAIALLDDKRTATPVRTRPGSRGRRGPAAGVIADAAADTLRAMVEPFAKDRMPADDQVATWNAFWAALLAGAPRTERVVASQPTTIVQIAENQSHSELVAVGDGGFALTVSRLQTRIDGNENGLAVTWPPFATRVWVTDAVREEIDIAAGPRGTLGVLSAKHDDSWSFGVITSQTTTMPALTVPIGKAKHAALASSGNDYLVAYIQDNNPALLVQPLDAAGTPRGGPHTIALPAQPASWYHRGFHSLKLVRRTGGWLAAVEAKGGGVYTVSLDDKLAPVVPPTRIAVSMDFAQPTVAMAADRAFVAWLQDRYGAVARLGVAVTRPDGTALATDVVGDEVWQVSRPVVLDDGGFAVAWIEAEEEVHVGRWTADGKLVGSAIVVPRHASWLTLALGREGRDLVVGYEDETRYPSKLVSLRIDPDALK